MANQTTSSPSSLDNYCGEPFWNSTLTWHTDDPDFTACFQKTVLVWIPCLFLWVFASLEVFYILNSKKRNIPWGFLNVLKFIFLAVLLILTVTDLATSIHSAADGETVYNVDIYTPIIKLLTFLLAGVFMFYNKNHGLQTSGLLFLFWFLLAFFGAVQFRSEIKKHVDEEEKEYSFISYMIYYPLVVLIFFLSCFADKEPLESLHPPADNPCPEQSASFLSRLFFAWFDPLAWKGYRNPLETKDLWSMNPEDCSPEVVARFEKHWKKTLEKHESTAAMTSPRASFKASSGRIDFADGKSKKLASILPALCKSFGGTFLFGACLKLIQDSLTFVSPQILKLLISFVEGKESLWKGYLYAILMLGTAMLQTMILAQYFNRMFLVGMRIRTALVSAIYRKALKLSNSARKESTVGEIVNLMSVDAQRFVDLTAYLNMIWSAPFQIAIAIYFLWDTLGPSVLAGLAVTVFLIPANGFIANKMKTLQIRQMKNKDERVKLMNEVLSGIKVLKLYAWEPSFESQILKIRNKEISVLRQAAYLNAGTSFIWSCAPFLVSMLTFAVYVYSDSENVLTPQKTFVALTLFSIIRLPMSLLPLVIVAVAEVSLVTFATYVLVDENNVLDAEKAFVSLALFNILRFPLNMLPMLISNMVQASVSVKRINKFMNAEELDPENISHDSDPNCPLTIESGTFTWGEEPILKNLNLNFKKASLNAVVGTVGSGKSSLISAFLGEMEKTNGKVNIDGSVAYVSQQAWIQNATLQDNILFGKSLDKKLYDKVVEACALKPDFEMLPAGDQTEIGEKGINLSGGQKQRVSLARAVYNDADIYFLDDPLSAVDSHVGKHIFENVIGPKGMLRKKTRVLVTHGITYLPEVDGITVLKQGEVSESGTYKELLAKKGDFADFLVQHLQESEEDAEDQDEIKQTLSATLGADELNKKIARQRSRVSESISEGGSAERERRSTNGSLPRQVSVESGGGGDAPNSVRRRTPEKEDTPPQTKTGEKLIEAEKSETGRVKWTVYSHYLRSIGMVLSLATILLVIGYQAFSIGSNFWLSVWSNDDEIIVNGTVDTGKRDLYLGVYGALGLGQAILSFMWDLLTRFGCYRAAVFMHMRMLHRIARAPLIFFETTPSGRILARFSKDVEVIDTSLPQTISDCLYCLFEVLATLFVITYSTWIFALVIIPVGLLYYFVQRFYVATSRQLKRLESVSRSPIYSHFGESVTGTQTIRAYGVQNRFIHESEAKVDYNQICYYPSIIANRWLAVRLEMVGNMIIFFASMFAVLEKDSLSSGLVGLSVSYALQMTQTLNWLVRMTSDVETNIVAVERIKEYGEIEQEAPWDVPATSPSQSWPELGSVEFRDYAVRYRQGLDLVLKGIDFSVKGGEKVGIVGRTGAGKSSLTLALFRIIEPAKGHIYIDGVDISSLGLHALRSRLTIIPQDAVLFSGSLRMNLDPFNTHSDDEVWKALEHAHLKSFVQGLAAGLNHEVSEGGENLSVGQRQLICLSRALLRKTRVLILDEATAAVDLETDDLIQRTIRTEFSECTVLTIAHRLNTIMDSDRVVVLDKGKIVEFDTPAGLLQNKKSVFYGMAKDAGLV